MPEPSRDLEHQADCLRARFNGWRIWYVRNPVTRSASWHAVPRRYPLDAPNAEELAAAIEADEDGEGLPHDDDHGWA